jgi:peptidoglycan pentaglycine glycine transferase (the first glycine)
VIQIRDRDAWRGALLDLPRPHVLQTWEWAEVKSRWGWRPLRFLWRGKGDSPLAAASVLERRFAGWPVRMLYVPKGPVLDWGDEELSAQVLADLESLAHERRAVLIKVDPDVFYPDSGLPQGVSSHAVRLEQQLALRGWRLSSEQVQFRNTALVDLTPDEDDLLRRMKSKTRYNVRLAGRRGVAIRHGDLDDLDRFHAMYAETARRDGFLIRPPAYYTDAWCTFLSRGLARLLLAEVKGTLIAGLMMLQCGATAWYLYGASTDRHRNLMPNHLLQWEAMRAARQAGCGLYDMWGAPDALEESDELWGVWRFKVGFGACWARGLGAWDYAPYALAYRLYSWLLPRYIRWLQRKQEGLQGASALGG